MYYIEVPMSFEWSEYLGIVQELIEQAKKSSYQEAKVRTAISRACYAAFGAARNHLRYKDKVREPRPLVNTNGERITIHEHVREKFKESDDEVRAEIGLTLERMCKNRNIADYDLYDSLFDRPDFLCQITLRWTKYVLSSLKGLS